jgi:hypothetical protein
MMLLRTLVLEHSGHDTPVNGALLCGFAVPQLASNFLAYSLDEEAEPGSSRVYIAALRKKSERYFLGRIDSKDDLEVAMCVLKQILTLAAASGAKSGGTAEAQVPYHFVDLKGCKLPPARPEDHHSLIIKKALVMKVITLGMSVPGLPAIESTSPLVPSIRFSSQMVAPPKAVRRIDPDVVTSPDSRVQIPVSAPAAIPSAAPVPHAPVETIAEAVSFPVLMHPVPDKHTRAASECDGESVSLVREERPSLFEVDSTLTNLARVAQELTQQKNALVTQQEELDQMSRQLAQEKADWVLAKQEEAERASLKEADLQALAHSLNTREEHLAHHSEGRQVEQRRLDERARYIESQSAQLHNRDLAVRHKEERLAVGLSQLSNLRNSLKVILHDMDETLALEVEPGHEQVGSMWQQP